jgi:hypothetical protein
MTMSHRATVALGLAAVAACVLLGGAAGGTRPAAGGTIQVRAGDDLQAALDRARPGDTVALERGATFVGNFVLSPKQGTGFVTVRTEGDQDLPPAGVRILPGSAGQLAKLRSPNTGAVLRTAAGAHHWRLQLLEFEANERGAGDIILLGSGDRDQTTAASVPHDLIIDRCYVHGDPETGQKRGIALNSAITSIVNSYISDIKLAGQDTQALGGWNGPGPFKIENNYLEAAGDNFLMGGAAPDIPGLVPADITFRNNHLAKPREWRGSKWQVKNLFELKNARRVLVEGNVFEYNWQAAQPGYAIVLTPRSSGGDAPWATVEDVVFRNNIVRHVAAVFNILGTDDSHASGPGRRIRIANNLFYDVSKDRWGGNGAFMQLGDGPSDVVVQHNTIIQSGNLVSAYGGSKDAPSRSVGFVFTDNIALHNTYGVFGAGRAYGNDSLAAFFTGPVFTSNVLAGGNASRYPGGNLFPSVEEFKRQFVDFDGDDLRLAPDSSFRGKGSDGSDLGARVEQVLRVAGPAVAPEPRGGTAAPRIR